MPPSSLIKRHIAKVCGKETGTFNSQVGFRCRQNFNTRPSKTGPRTGINTFAFFDGTFITVGRNYRNPIPDRKIPWRTIICYFGFAARWIPPQSRSTSRVSCDFYEERIPPRTFHRFSVIIQLNPLTKQLTQDGKTFFHLFEYKIIPPKLLTQLLNHTSWAN